MISWSKIPGSSAIFLAQASPSGQVQLPQSQIYLRRLRQCINQQFMSSLSASQRFCSVLVQASVPIGSKQKHSLSQCKRLMWQQHQRTLRRSLLWHGAWITVLVSVGTFPSRTARQVQVYLSMVVRGVVQAITSAHATTRMVNFSWRVKAQVAHPQA